MFPLLRLSKGSYRFFNRSGPSEGFAAGRQPAAKLSADRMVVHAGGFYHETGLNNTSFNPEARLKSFVEHFLRNSQKKTRAPNSNNGSNRTKTKEGVSRENKYAKYARSAQQKFSKRVWREDPILAAWKAHLGVQKKPKANPGLKQRLFWKLRCLLADTARSFDRRFRGKLPLSREGSFFWEAAVKLGHFPVDPLRRRLRKGGLVASKKRGKLKVFRLRNESGKPESFPRSEPGNEVVAKFFCHDGVQIRDSAKDAWGWLPMRTLAKVPLTGSTATKNLRLLVENRHRFR